MQETYGSGELISEELGFHFHVRVPIYQFTAAFQFGKTFLFLKNLNVWGFDRCATSVPSRFLLHLAAYGKDIWLPEVRRQVNDDQLMAACQPSAMTKIWSAIQRRLSDESIAICRW